MISLIKILIFSPVIDKFLVLLSVKTVSESEILVLSPNNTKFQPVDEETADNELFVVYNGPEISEAEDILEEKLRLHFKDYHIMYFFVIIFLCHSIFINKARAI